MLIVKMFLSMYFVVVITAVIITWQYCKICSVRARLWPFMRWWQKAAFWAGTYVCFLIPIFNMYLACRFLEQINLAYRSRKDIMSSIRRIEAARKSVIVEQRKAAELGEKLVDQISRAAAASKEYQAILAKELDEAEGEQE